MSNRFLRVDIAWDTEASLEGRRAIGQIIIIDDRYGPDRTRSTPLSVEEAKGLVDQLNHAIAQEAPSDAQ